MSDRELSGAEEGVRGWARERQARSLLGWLGDTLTPLPPVPGRRWQSQHLPRGGRPAPCWVVGCGLCLLLCPSLGMRCICPRQAADLPAVTVMESRGPEKARARRRASQSGGGTPPAPGRVCSASLRPWVCIRPPGSRRHMNINSLLFFISGSKSLCELNCRHANNPIFLGRVSPLGSICKTNVCHPRVSTLGDK